MAILLDLRSPSPKTLDFGNLSDIIVSVTRLEENYSIISPSIITPDALVSVTRLDQSITLNNPSITASSQYFVNDTFTDTAGVTLGNHIGETGADWTKYSAYTNDNLVISDINGIRHDGLTPTTVAYYSSGISSLNNVDLNFGIIRKGTLIRQIIEIGGRAQTAQVTYIGVRWSFDNLGWDIIKRVNNSSSTLSSVYRFDLEQDRLYDCKLIINDSIIKLLIDGTEILSSTQVDVSGTGRVATRFFTGSGNTIDNTNNIQFSYINSLDQSSTGYYVNWTTPQQILTLNNNELQGIPQAVNVTLPNLTLNLVRNFNKVYPPNPVFTTNERIDEVRNLIYQNNTHHNKVFQQLSADTQGNYLTSAYNNQITYGRTSSAIEQATMYSLTRDNKYSTSAYQSLRLIYDDPVGQNMLLGSGLNRATVSVAFAHVYTWCYVAFDNTQLTWLEDRITDGLNAWPSFSHDNISDSDKTSNWVGKVRGAELLLILSFQDWITRKTRLDLCISDLSKHLDNLGDNGYNQEGVDYSGFSLGTLIPASESLILYLNDYTLYNKCISKKVHIQDLYRNSYSFFAMGLSADNNDYTHNVLGNSVDSNGYNTSNVISEVFFRTIPNNELKYWRWHYDKTVGISADIPEQSKYDPGTSSGSSGRLFSLLYYNEKISPESPQGVYPKSLYDSVWGSYVFRNRWQDKNDTIIQTHSKIIAKDHSWSYSETFNLELISNNQLWFSNPSKYVGSFAPTSLLVNGVSMLNDAQTGLHEYNNFDTSANKGYTIVDGGNKYTGLGLISAKRHLFVDFADDDIFSIFSTLDILSASSTKEYSWQGKIGGIDANPTILMTSGSDSSLPFILLSGRDNSYLKGWFISTNETLTTNNLKYYYDIDDGGSNIGDAFRLVTSATNTKIWSIFAQGVGTAPTATIVSGTGIDTKLAIDSRNVWYETSANRILSEANIVVVDTTVSVTKFTEMESLNNPNISSENILSIPKFTETKNIISPTIVNVSNVTNAIPKFTEIESLETLTVTNSTNVTNSISTFTETESLNNPTVITNSIISIPKFTETESLNNPNLSTGSTLNVTKFTENETLNNPTVITNSIISIPKFTEIESLETLTVTNSTNVTISIPKFTEIESLNNPNLSTGSTLNVTKFIENETLNNPSISTQSIISINKFTEIESLVNPTVINVSNVTNSIPKFTETESLNNPTVITNSIISIPKFTEIESFVNPEVLVGGNMVVSIPKFPENESIINPNIITNSIIIVSKLTLIENIISPNISTSSNISISKFTENDSFNNPNVLTPDVLITISKFTEIESIINPIVSISNTIFIPKFTENESLINSIVTTNSIITIPKFTETESSINPDVLVGGNITISVNTFNENILLTNPTISIDTSILVSKFTENSTLINPNVTIDSIISILKFVENEMIPEPNVIINDLVVLIQTFNEIFIIEFDKVLVNHDIITPILENSYIENINGLNVINGEIIPIYGTNYTDNIIIESLNNTEIVPIVGNDYSENIYEIL